MYDITPTICTTSYTLYKASHPYFMRSHHIMYDITCIVFLTSLPLYLTLHALYLCHQDQCINYTTPTLCVTSHTLYLWRHIQYACYHNNCLWHYTPLCIISEQLYVWHHTHFIYDILCTIRNVTSTVLMISQSCISEITSAITHDIISIVYDMAATGSLS